MNDHRARQTGRWTMVATLVTLLTIGCQATQPTQPAGAPTSSAAIAGATAPASPVAASPVAGAGTAKNLSVAIREVAQRVKPAVVQITIQQIEVDRFRQPFQIPAGVGSGVIYDRDGHILTNNHVVEGADGLFVSLPDGRTFEGDRVQLVGRDPQTDLAVIQIKGANLPVAELGDSGLLQVGDWVVAIGNALGLPGGPTVSTGVVGALGRTVQEPGGPSGGQGPFLFDVIQTDAPINPGNSGGPLVNLDGQVIGINTLVAGQAEPGLQAQGIGFAIAIATAKPIADELVRNGRVAHPYLGIRYVAVNPVIAAQLRLAEKTGAYVQQVIVGSPAALAGVIARDLITEIDGVALQSESALAREINKHKPGDRVTLTVVRDSQKSSVQVTLGEMPSPS